jgi:outer membrane receptor protein involved in Fe transport
MFFWHINPAVAQLTRGFVSGIVTDTMNGVMAGVQVTLTNKGTSITRGTLTNEVGFYRFAAVEPGEYSLEFKIAGFQTHRIDSLTVSTAQEVVINQILNVSNLTEEVSIETTGVALDKTTAAIERTFSAQTVTEMPLLYTTARDITRLALLAPTVNRAPGSTEFSANGQRARNNNFTLDGVDNNDQSVTLSVARVPPEAVQEVQVQTTAYSAEFGRNSGAQVSAITKGGTNELHGEAYDYYRGNWMEPISLTNKRAGLKETPRFVHNQFGGDLGGPIIKERTFFFGLLEFNRRREAPDARNGATTPPNIPTPAGYASLSTVPLRSGQSAASRQAVLSALSFLPDVYKQVSNYEQVRTLTINGVPIEMGTIRIPIANPHNFWYNVLRIDHKLTNNDVLTYRYHLDHRIQPDVTSNLQFGTRWSAAQTIFAQNHAISETHTFNARLLNEARLAYARRNLDFPEDDPKSPTVGITGFFTIGGLSNYPQGRLQHTFQFQDIVSYVTGRHALKFGIDVRRNLLFNRSSFDSKGTWTFNGLAEFMNNSATLLRQAVNEASFYARQWDQAYFVQDDLKATRDLTLNLGVRYEYSTVPLGFFGATDPGIRAGGVPGPVRSDKNNWAPRLGFAYSPSSPKGMLAALLGEGQTSVRGGFGMTYDVLFANILTVNASNYPRVLNSDTANPVDLFPALAPKTASVPPFNPLTNGFSNSPESLQRPTTAFWSLSVQREFGRNYVVEAGYTGNRSYHQIRQGQANPPILTAQQAATVLTTGDPNSISNAQARRLNPNWNSRTLIESAAKAEYHAGYLRFDKQMSNGLAVGANYTWSANFSDNDESLAVTDITNSSPQIPQDFFNFRREWSRSVFDRPHRFVVHYVYAVPWFSSSWASQSLRHILGGWEISGFTEFQSGQPFTIRTGVDTVGTAAGGTNPPGRPNYNPNGILTRDPDTHDLRTFITPIGGTGIVTAPLDRNGNILANSMPGGGNLGRNTFRGPSFQQWNFGLMKKITFSETRQVQIRADFVNLFNHNNFQNPEARMNSPSFGLNTATLLSDSRLMLFSAKLKF